MSSNYLFNFTCLGIQNTNLGSISISNMGYRIGHICTKRIGLRKIFCIINLTDHIFYA